MAVLTPRPAAGGPPILVIENEDGAGPNRLRDSAAAVGFELDVRLAERDPIPERLGEAAGLVVLGGSYYVRDAERWPHLYRVMDLIREAEALRRPALGICLGGQLAASALGGEVGPGERGPEIGWVTVRATEEGADDPLGAAVGEGTPLLMWHHDVFTPPPGAVRVMTSDGYPDQGFRRGTVWGLQSHPEVDADLVARWCRSPGGAADLESASIPPDDLTGPAADRSEGAWRVPVGQYPRQFASSLCQENAAPGSWGSFCTHSSARSNAL